MKELLLGGFITTITILVGAYVTYIFTIKASLLEKYNTNLLELYFHMKKLANIYSIYCDLEYNLVNLQNSKYKLDFIKYDEKLCEISEVVSKQLLFIKDKKIVSDIIDVLYSIDTVKFPTSAERRIRIYELTDEIERAINKAYNQKFEFIHNNNLKYSEEFFDLEKSKLISPAPAFLSPITIEEKIKALEL